MTIKELWAKLMGVVTVPDEKKAEFEALQAAAEKTFTPQPSPTPGNGSDIEAIVARAVANAVEPLKADNAALAAALKEEAEARKQATQALLDKQKADQTAKIEATLKEAIDAGKIPALAEDQKELWKGLMEKDFEGAKKAIDALPVVKSNAQQQQQQQQQKSGSSEQAEDPGAALRANAASAFANN